MNETSYNGWTNYETWNVSLWLDNEESTYLEVQEYAREMADRVDPDAIHFTKSDAVYEMADWLKSYVEELAEQTCPGVLSGASFVADMFGAALSEVNWTEIAHNTLDEMLSEVVS